LTLQIQNLILFQSISSSLNSGPRALKERTVEDSQL